MAKADLIINPPLLNSAGMLGFTPDFRSPVAFHRFGAFITNPVSLAPRKPARSATSLKYPSGFLLHNGYPNPGLRRVIRQWSLSWSRSPLPVIVSLIPQNSGEISQMFEKLEGLSGVMGVEICLQPGMSTSDLSAIVNASFGELSVILSLPFDLAASFPEGVSASLLEAGLAAVSIQPPRGALENETGHIINGRLYGPAIFPQTLFVTRHLVGLGLPVISSGGVYRPGEVEQLLNSGAVAVQLGAVLWRDPGLNTWSGLKS